MAMDNCLLGQGGGIMTNEKAQSLVLPTKSVLLPTGRPNSNGHHRTQHLGP